MTRNRPVSPQELLVIGMSRRELMRLLGVSAGAVGLGSLMVACGEEDAPEGAGSSVTPTTSSTDSAEPTEVTGEDDTSPTEEATADTSAEEDDRPELIIGVQGLPDSLDPHQHLSNVGTRVTYSLFDHPMERDFQSGNPPGTGSGLLPMLATEWERIDDLTLELTLREDVLFHNGDPMTAEDIKFTFDRMMIDTQEELTEALGYVSTLTSVEVVDDYTVRLITAEPDPILEKRLSSWATWILPKAYYEQVGMEGFAQAPVGTGPYKFVELRPDEHLVLEAFDDYWDGRPTASRVTFRVIPETAGRVSAVASGEVDIITNVPPDQVSTLESSDGVEVKSVPLANCHVLVYNTTHPVIQDKRLRQALNLGIDRQLLIDTLWNGTAVPMRSHQFEEYGDLYNADRPYTPYDPDQARALIEESGYDGAPIIYYTQAAYYTFGLEAGQAIVEMWREIGINAEIQVREDLSSIPMEEMMVRNWSNSSFTADPDGAFWLRWGPEAWPQTRGFWTPENPRFNEIGFEARQTLDGDLRFDLYQEMLDIWEDEAPGTVLYIPVENYAMRDNVDWLPYSFYYMDLRPDNLTIS